LKGLPRRLQTFAALLLNDPRGGHPGYGADLDLQTNRLAKVLRENVTDPSHGTGLGERPDRHPDTKPVLVGR
jgi:hypothetical protein